MLLLLIPQDDLNNHTYLPSKLVLVNDNVTLLFCQLWTQRHEECENIYDSFNYRSRSDIGRDVICTTYWNHIKASGLSRYAFI